VKKKQQTYLILLNNKIKNDGPAVRLWIYVLESLLRHVCMLSHVSTDDFGAFQVSGKGASNDFIERQNGRSKGFFCYNPK
jgi:hypothetical protein